MSSNVMDEQITPAVAAHANFDKCHQATVAAQGRQAELRKKHAAIIARLGDARQVAVEIEASAMDSAAAGDWPEFETAATSLHEVRARADLLRKSARWLDVTLGNDAKTAVLECFLAEEQARLLAEQARKTELEENILAGISAASTLAGGLSLTGFGPVSDELTRICEAAEAAIRRATEALEAHVTEMQEQRITFAKEYQSL